MAITLVTSKYAPLKPGKRDVLRLNARLSDGLPLEMSYGTFSCSASLEWRSNMLQRGMGPKLTTVTFTDGNFSRVVNADTDTATGNSFIKVEGLTFDFNGAAGSEDVHGIRLQNVSDFWMRDCELFDAPHHNFVSIDTATDVNARWYIDNVFSYGAGQRTGTQGDGFRPAAGFQQANPEDGAILTGCRARGNSHHGFHLGNGVVAIGCHSDSNTTANGYLADHNSQIIGGIWSKPIGHNIIMQGAQGAHLKDATIDGSGTTGHDTVNVDGTANTDAKISGNIIKNSLRYGIGLESGEITISDNTIDGNDTGQIGIYVVDVSRIKINDNIIKGWTVSAGRGVMLDRVSGAISRINLNDNHFYQNGTGLYVDNDTVNITNIWMDGSHFDGQTTTDINDAGGIVRTGTDFSLDSASKYALSSHAHA